MFVIVDDTKTTPNYFWKMSSGLPIPLTTVDLSKAQMYQNKQDAKNRLGDINSLQDEFWKFRIAELVIKPL